MQIHNTPSEADIYITLKQSKKYIKKNHTFPHHYAALQTHTLRGGNLNNLKKKVIAIEKKIKADNV